MHLSCSKRCINTVSFRMVDRQLTYLFLELRLPHFSLHRRDQVLKALEEFGDVNGTCFTEKYWASSATIKSSPSWKMKGALRWSYSKGPATDLREEYSTIFTRAWEKIEMLFAVWTQLNREREVDSYWWSDESRQDNIDGYSWGYLGI